MDSKKITKECSFFASEFHLVTMLLPHINKVLNEEIKVITILQKNYEEEIKLLLNKLNLKNENKILEIGWNKKDLNDIDKRIEDNTEIIVSGDIEYIEKINKLIEEKIDKKIKIINCYNVKDIRNIKDILDIHECVLNTSGEKTIEEFKRAIN